MDQHFNILNTRVRQSTGEFPKRNKYRPIVHSLQTIFNPIGLLVKFKMVNLKWT